MLKLHKYCPSLNVRSPSSSYFDMADWWPRLIGVGQILVGLIQAVVTWRTSSREADRLEERLRRLEAGLLQERGERTEALSYERGQVAALRELVHSRLAVVAPVRQPEPVRLGLSPLFENQSY